MSSGGRPSLREVLIEVVRKGKTRFAARIQRNSVRDGDCLLWTGPVNNHGYPRMNVRALGKHMTLYVHRVMYVLSSGSDIPSGLEIDHSCYRRNCIEPKHLEPVTHAENMQRMMARRLSAAEEQELYDAIEECL